MSSSFIDLLEFTDVCAYGDTLNARYTMPHYLVQSINLDNALSMNDVRGARNRGEIIGFLKFMAKSCGCDIHTIKKIDLVENDYRVGSITILLDDTTSSGYSAPSYAGSGMGYTPNFDPNAWRNFFGH